ncbi:MAG: hypothetical protein O2782_22160 [bacterium]|nr:hypothetical protein [bacterium]
MKSALLAVIFLSASAASMADLPEQALAQPRKISERSWLELHLQVLGHGLSYPAYRVSVGLTDSNRVRFEFWISTPMAQHLTEAGREESERILAYHAEGIQKRVGDLLHREFAALWSGYDAKRDFQGEFMTPGVELDDPPERWASWQKNALQWSWSP